MKSGLTFSVFPSSAEQIYVRAPWRVKLQHFAWPVRVLKVEFFRPEKKYQNLTIFGILQLFQIFQIPLLSTLKDQSKCLHFLPGYFFVYLRQAEAYYPFAGTPSLEPKHETHTHTQILTAFQTSIGL